MARDQHSPASAPSRRSIVTNLPRQRGLSPVNGAIRDRCDTVITPATAKIVPWHVDLPDL
jgi:hypothetical protein